MSMAPDPVSICFDDLTFDNLLKATPSMFTSTPFAVFRLITEAFRVGLILTMAIAVHTLLIMLGAFALVDCALAAVCTLLDGFIDKYRLGCKVGKRVFIWKRRRIMVGGLMGTWDL